MNARQRAAAFAGVSAHVADVARAETDHRASLLAQRRVHQLARLTRSQHFAGRRIHRLHEDLVLHDVQAVVRLARSGAGTVDIGQAVEVDHLRAPEVLDGLARGLDGATRLAGHDDGVDVEVFLGVEALLLGDLAEVPRVGRRRPDDGGLVLLEHEQQAVGRHGAHPDGQRAQALRADDVGAAHVQGEVQAVHVAVVRAHARLPEQTSLGVLPQVEVLLREGADRGHARRARRGGHEDDLFLGHGAHLAEEAAHMLRLALRLLVAEGELRDVVERFDVARLHAGLVERALVVHCVVVCVGHHVLQALKLQRLKLRPRHAFDLRIIVLLIVGDVLRHGCSLFVCVSLLVSPLRAVSPQAFARLHVPGAFAHASRALALRRPPCALGPAELSIANVSHETFVRYQGLCAQCSVLHETTNATQTQPFGSFDVLMVCYRWSR